MLGSVHHKSGQLFEHSNVVHIIFVQRLLLQPQEVQCFIASADKKITLQVGGERRRHIETFKACWLPLCSARQEQHLLQHVRIDRWHKNS